MSDNPRDTHFTGFAELLFDDLPWNDINIDMEKKGWEERWQAEIAQRAYDLVCHAVSQVTGQMGDEMEAGTMTPQDCVEYVPDLTKWPKER